MAELIRMNVYLTVPEEKLGEFKSVAKDMTARARAEDLGTLSYEWFETSEGENTFQVLEVFESSEALLTYFERGGADPAGQRFLEVCKVTKIELCGRPSDEVRKQLDALGMAIDYQLPLDGFTR